MKLIYWLYTFLIVTILSALEAQAVPLVCFGDSVVEAHAPTVQPGESYCDQIGGLNAGHGGDTTYQGINRFKQDVLSHHPKIITIGFGLNDPSNGIPLSEFKANILSMIRMAGKRRVILLTPNPRPSDYLGETKEQLNAKLYPYVLTLRYIAKRKKVQLVDVYQTFAELSLRANLLAYFADIIHPNALGHKIIANILINKGKI
jgi:acyl-CoA thioesterase I